jgi:phenylpyruvate tautomerase PptA (4-oxalocrotonate tautomerase family)
MPFVETFLFKNDEKKFEKIAKTITQDLCKTFKLNKSTITIYNNIIEKKNFFHNSILRNSEKRIFIKIFCLKRSKNLKKKLAFKIIKNIQKLLNIKNPDNIAIYFFDKPQFEIYHGKTK